MYPPSAYIVSTSQSLDPQELGEWGYSRVFRATFSEPGFAVIDCGDTSSRDLRQRMVQLARVLNQLHQARSGKSLIYTAVSRFDQQVTTKLHRDGAPDETVLLLGYEATDVESVVAMADHTKCAHDRGLTPQQFLDDFNPMYAQGEAALAPYLTELSTFGPQFSCLVLINNSNAPFQEHGTALLGVLHTARIVQPRADRQRVVNSMMMASVPPGTPSPITAAEIDDFLTTDLVRKYAS